MNLDHFRKLKILITLLHVYKIEKNGMYKIL